jgi:hypothetical protein
MSFAVHSEPPTPAISRVTDLPRQAQFLILTLRLARELSIENRNFQGFVCALCGISRVEQALAAIADVLWCVNQASRRLTIESTAVDDLAQDEQRLLELLRFQGEPGRVMAASLVPRPVDLDLMRSLRRLAAALE